MIKFLKSIRMKIWLCVNVAFFGYLIATMSSIYTNSRLSENLTSLGSVDFPLSRYGSELVNTFKKQTKLYEDAFLLGEESSAVEGNTLAAEITSLLNAATAAGSDKADERMTMLKTLQSSYGTYAALASESYLRLAQGEELEDSQGTIRKLGEMQRGILKDLESVSKGLVLAVEEKIQQNKTIAYNNTRFQIILLGVVLVLASIIINLIANRLLVAPLKKIQELVVFLSQGKFHGVQKLNTTSRDEIGSLSNALDSMLVNLQKVAAMATQIAEGNLDVRVELVSSEDELGLALTRMTENLNEVLGNIQAAGEQITSGSAQVSNSSQALSQGATEQASSLEEITSSMTEMASQTRLNAENATQASHLSNEARDFAEEGNTQMQRMIGAMSEINESGKNISKIIKAIDEIAFQTNLLALNAAVEAARAGQHGKGFAVVAEEVRNLAARSAKAANETAELIEGSAKKAENGVQIASRTAESLEKIVSGVGKVSALVAEIAAASSEQAQGISQINEGLGQIDQVTQQNTANAEESAAAAEELSSQAQHLQHMLKRFKVSKPQSVRRAPESLGYLTPQPVIKSAQKAEISWGQSKPSEVIALDDAEFGRY